MSEAAECAAQLRADLEAMRPNLLRLKSVYVANIEAIERSPSALFMWVPEMRDGEFATLSKAVEEKCSLAVLRVLRRELAMVNKALGKNAG